MEKFTCPICQKELKNINVYNSHLTWHKNNDTYPDGIVCPICYHHLSSLKSFKKHESLFHKDTQDKIKIYRIFSKDDSNHFCEHCGKEALLLSSSRGFEKYCSIECRNILNKQSHKKAMENMDYSKVDFKKRYEKSVKTNQEKYGTNNPAQSIEIKEKMRLTNQKRRGVDYPCQSKNVMKKRVDTNNKLYGFDYGLSSPEIIKKRIDNLIRTRGVINVFQLPEVKQKNIEKYMKNFGVINPYLSKKCMINKSLFYYRNYLKKTKRATPLFSIDEWHTRKENPFLQFECPVCKNKFLFSVLSGMKPRCFDCYPLLTKSASKGEGEILDYLKTYNIDAISNDRKVLKPKELDIYIPKYNLAIEFNGLYWHSESNNISKEYHLLKTEKCKSLGIKLIHIFENEWNYKKDIVKSILLSNFNIFDKKIGARQCIVNEVSAKDARPFYDMNHLQGFIGSTIHIGLFFNGELTSCLSFSKPRFNKKYDWEITRYATKLNTQIIGGFGKLWKHKPEGSIITYSDKRYFTGSVYSKYMSQLPDTEPSYYYIVDGETKNRMEFQKHKLEKILPKFDNTLTEWENMKLNGYTRIWDCGNLCFEHA